MQNVLVSVIVMTYNQQQFVSQAIDSILMQKTDFSYETIISDDASQDGTADILKKYESQNVKILYHKENQGGCKSYEDALQCCKGKYIVYLEGDDFWTDKNKMQTQTDFLEQHEEFIGVGHDILRVDERGNQIGKLLNENCGYSVNIKDSLYQKKRIGFTTLMYRKEAIISHDLRILHKLSRNQGDRTLVDMLLHNGMIWIMPVVYSAYRIRQKQGNSNFNSIYTEYEKYQNRLKIDLGLEKYFEYRYSYTYRIICSSLEYLFYALVHRKKLHLIDIYKQIGRNRFLLLLGCLPIYSMKRIWKKIGRTILKKG